MLQTLQLVNVKGFKDTGPILLRPITLLIGQNSSGKSSLVRFPLVLRQTLLDDSMAPVLFYGRSIDYGSYQDVVFKHEQNRRINFEVTIDLYHMDRTIYLRRLRVALQDWHPRLLTISVQIGKREHALVVHKFVVSTEGRRILLKVTRRNDGQYRILCPKRGDKEGIDIITSNLTFDKFMPDLRVLYTGLVIDRPKDERLRSLEFLYDLHLVLSAYWSEFANSVSYIGPFRRTPERAYRHTDNAVWHVGGDGEFAPVILAQDARSNHMLVHHVSEWLRKNLGFRLKVENLGGDMFRVLVTDEDTGVTSNLIDVGHGLSQLIPIVTQTFMTRRATTRSIGHSYDLMIVEQPELHLHPAAQASLADLLVDGINLNTRRPDRPSKCYLIETHSEHLLLRLRRYIVEDRIQPNQVALYYASKQPGDKAISISPLDIRPDGSIPDWPKGFFSQDYQEALRIRQAQLQKNGQGSVGLW